MSPGNAGDEITTCGERWANSAEYKSDRSAVLTIKSGLDFFLISWVQGSSMDDRVAM